MTALAIPFTPAKGATRIKRTSLSDARDGRLYFAQVREDPLLEIEALRVARGGKHIVVGSGGCTALSMLRAGADNVVAVDMNPTQNHVTELKAIALAILDSGERTGFLGGQAMPGWLRMRRYESLRHHLSPAAVTYWDANRRSIAHGVIRSGVSERFIGILSALVKTAIHPASRIEKLLSCSSIADQCRLYDNEWNNRRWRALFRVLLNRWTMNRTYDPAFFSNVENESFSAHFHRLFERTIREVPVATNYFLHQMLTGSYPSVPRGLPPYLDEAAVSWEHETFARLEIVDGSYEAYLSRCGASSVDGFALSNICEWLPATSVDALFSSVARVAKPGARVVFRNFVGHTTVPAWIADVIVEDHEAGRAAILRDRSCVQARIAVCTVRKPA